MKASATGSSPSAFVRIFGSSVVALLAAGALTVGCAQGGGSGNEGSGGDNGGGTGGSGTTNPGVGGSGAGAAGTTGGSVGGSTGTGGAATGTGGRSGSGGMTGGGVGGSGVGGAPAPVTAYWVSTTGNDTNPGTQASPFATLLHANLFAKPGITIWIMPGAYPSTFTVTFGNSGTATNPINVFAAPGARPVLDYAPQKAMPVNDNLRGIDITGSYWHLRGIEVKNANDNGIAISGSNNTVEDVIIDFSGDTGLQITVPDSQASDNTRGANNLILNCDSHDNYDAATKGENADGFAAKLNIGNGNIFRGCRSYNNSDDGYDLFGVPEPVTIDHCWAALNGHLASGTKGPASDGNGFKLGGDNVPALHVVTSSFAMTNDTCGFTLNSNAAQPRITGSGVNGNKTGTFCSLTNVTGTVTISMTGAQAAAAQRLTNVAAGMSTLPPVQ